MSELERWDQDHDTAGRVVVSGIRVETKNEGRPEQV